MAVPRKLVPSEIAAIRERVRDAALRAQHGWHNIVVADRRALLGHIDALDAEKYLPPNGSCRIIDGVGGTAMYEKEMMIDGHEVKIQQTASGAGSRFEIQMPGGQSGLAGTLLGRVRGWCARIQAEVRNARAHAHQEGATLYVEVTGANGAIETWLPKLEAALTGAKPAAANKSEHAGAATT